MSPLLTTKDLAAAMLLHPRTVKKWWRKLRVSPRIRGHGCHRWTHAQAALLLKRWHDYWIKRGVKAPAAAAVYSGAVKRAADKQQLRLELFAKGSRK